MRNAANERNPLQPTDLLAAVDEISTSQIKALREEAMSAGDYRQVTVCDVALAPLERDNSDGTPLEDYDGDPMTRTEARQLCADAVNAAKAAS